MKNAPQPTNRTAISQWVRTVIRSISPACADAATGISSKFMHLEAPSVRLFEHPDPPPQVDEKESRNRREHGDGHDQQREDARLRCLGLRRVGVAEAHRARQRECGQSPAARSS